MSVVAIKKIGKGRFQIAADSIRVNGFTQEKDKKAKLWAMEDIAIGSVGDCAVSFIFKEFLENNKPKFNTEYGWTLLMSEFEAKLKTVSNSLELKDSSFIVVFKKKAFILANLYVKEIRTWYAVGAGADYALAALELGHTAKKACEVSCALSIYCEKPVTQYEII